MIAEAHELQVADKFCDEVHLKCPLCGYFRAVPLKINGSFDGLGHVVKQGDRQFGHVYKRVNFDA